MQEARGPVAQRPLVTAAAATAVACLLALGKGLCQHGGEAPRGDRWGAGAALPSTDQQQQQRPPAPTKQPPQQSLAQTQAAPPTCAATATGLYGGSYSGDRGPPAARSGDGYEARHKGSPSILSSVGHGVARFLRLTLALLGYTLLLLTLVGALVTSLQLLPALEDASTRLDRTLVEACCDAVLPCHADDEENNELAAALAARSPLRGRLLVETGVQTSLSLLLPLLLSASASASAAQPPSGGAAVADKGVATEPVIGEEAGTMADAGPTANIGTQTTVLALAATEEAAERGEDAAAPPVMRPGSSSGSHPPGPIGPPPSAAPRLCKFDSGLSEDSAPLVAEGGSAGGPLVLVSGDGTEGAHAVGGSSGASSSLLLLGGTPLLPVLGDGSGGSAFLSFFPPPGLSPPSTPPIGHGHGRPAPARAEGSEPLATKQEAAAGPAEDAELGRIGAEEERDEEKEASGDGAGDGDWAATNLSLGQALKRLRAASKECAALAADKARLARHLEQMEGTNFLVGAEKERLADEAAHLRAEVARLEKAVRELEEDVEELRLAVKHAEDKAEAYHGALIKERQWHKSTKEKLGHKIDEVKKERDGALATAAAVMRQNAQHGPGGSSNYFPHLGGFARGGPHTHGPPPPLPPPPHHHKPSHNHPMGPPPPFNHYGGGAPGLGLRGLPMGPPHAHPHGPPPPRFPSQEQQRPQLPSPAPHVHQPQPSPQPAAAAPVPTPPLEQQLPALASATTPGLPDAAAAQASTTAIVLAPTPLRVVVAPPGLEAEGGGRAGGGTMEDGAASTTAPNSSSTGPILSWAPGCGSIFY